MRDPVEHGAVGAVGHGVEGDLEIDGLRRARLADFHCWHKGGVIHVVIFNNKSEVG
jgi:hypothetical protein